MYMSQAMNCLFIIHVDENVGLEVTYTLTVTTCYDC